MNWVAGSHRKLLCCDCLFFFSLFFLEGGLRHLLVFWVRLCPDCLSSVQFCQPGGGCDRRASVPPVGRSHTRKPPTQLYGIDRYWARRRTRRERKGKINKYTNKEILFLLWRRDDGVVAGTCDMSLPPDRGTDGSGSADSSILSCVPRDGS